MIDTPFVKELKEIISEKALLKHPFYQAWEKGELPLESMQKYAEQYYHLESNFPLFLSRMHAVCDNAFDIRQEITDNLYDEEHGEVNHRELWLKFGEGIGANREAMQTCERLPETDEAVESLKEVCGDSALHGASALAAYESQMPEVSKSKIEGLAKHYNITDKDTIKFFEVHGVLDVDHADAWWRIIDKHADTEEKRNVVREAVKAGRDALWKFLDGVQRAYVQVSV